MVEKLHGSEAAGVEKESLLKRILGKLVVTFGSGQRNEVYIQRQRIEFEAPEPVLSDDEAKKLHDAVERLIASPRARAAWEGKTEEI